MKRHVLHVISGLAVGGAEMALYRLILEFRGSEYTHTVIALTPEGGISKSSVRVSFINDNIYLIFQVLQYLTNLLDD